MQQTGEYGSVATSAAATAIVAADELEQKAHDESMRRQHLEALHEL